MRLNADVLRETHFHISFVFFWSYANI